MKGAPWGSGERAPDRGAAVGLGVVGKSPFLSLLFLLCKILSRRVVRRERDRAWKATELPARSCAAERCARPPQGQMEKDSVVKGPHQEGLCPCTRACSVSGFLVSLLTLAEHPQTVLTPPPG